MNSTPIRSGLRLGRLALLALLTTATVAAIAGPAAAGDDSVVITSPSSGELVRIYGGSSTFPPDVPLQVTFSVTGSPATCGLDDQAPTPCSSPTTFPHVTPGTHTVTVAAGSAIATTTFEAQIYLLGRPPRTGTDLVITSVRSHAGVCTSSSGGEWQSGGCQAGRDEQGAGQSITQLIGDMSGSRTVSRMDIRNLQPNARRITLKGAGATRGYRVRYLAGRKDITSSVIAGTYRTPRIRSGATSRIRLVVTTQAFVRNGRDTGVLIPARPAVTSRGRDSRSRS
jgi:hypothetical protein